MSTKSEILKYIMHTPENTNPGIVEGMLDSLEGTGETYNPTSVSASDEAVQVNYNNECIGVLNDNGSLTLKTGGTRVEHDINVNYTKPSGSAIGNTVNLSTDIAGAAVVIKGPFIDTTGVYSFALQAAPYNPGSTLALCEEGRYGYSVFLTFENEEDIYSMTVNGTPVTFDRGAYRFISSPSADPVNGQTYNVVITNKQV